MGCGAEPGQQGDELVAEDEVGVPQLVLVAPTADRDEDFMMEADACRAIVQTYAMHGLDIGCPTTIKTCPGLFRDSFGVSCMRYEASPVRECVESIEAATTCDEIRAASCEVAPVWGSEPLGCDATY